MAQVMKSFEPYYHSKLGHVTSRKHEEKLFREKGVSNFNDHHKMKQEAAYIRKHKEEIIKESYDKQGLKYKPGSNTVFDEKQGRFVPRPR